MPKKASACDATMWGLEGDATGIALIFYNTRENPSILRFKRTLIVGR